MLGTRLKRTIVTLVVAIVAISAILVGCSAHKYGGDFYSSDDSFRVKEAKLIIGAAKMTKKIDKGSMYPQYYRILKGFEIRGKSKDEAPVEAKAAIVKRLALYQYAQENGMNLSDEDIEANLEGLLNSFKTSERVKDTYDAFQKEGESFDDYFKANREYYKQVIIASRAEKVLTESGYNKIDMLNAKEKEIIDNFKTTKKYEKAEEVINLCYEAFKKYGSNIEAINEKYGDKLNLNVD